MLVISYTYILVFPYCLSVNVSKILCFLIPGLILFYQAYSDIYLSKQDKDLSPISISKIQDFMKQIHTLEIPPPPSILST